MEGIWCYLKRLKGMGDRNFSKMKELQGLQNHKIENYKHHKFLWNILFWFFCCFLIHFPNFRQKSLVIQLFFPMTKTIRIHNFILKHVLDHSKSISIKNTPIKCQSFICIVFLKRIDNCALGSKAFLSRILFSSLEQWYGCLSVFWLLTQLRSVAEV